MERKDLLAVVKVLNKETDLLEKIGEEKIPVVGKGTKLEDLMENFKRIMLALDDKELIDETPEDCIDFWEENLEEFVGEATAEVEEPEEEEPEKESMKKKGGKKKEKLEKATGKKPEVGVIASILEFVLAAKKPISFEKIADKLSDRFPERDKTSMLKTVKAQLGGKKRPTRMEKEKKVKLNISEKGVMSE